MPKKFILNADDFGMSGAINRAVLEAYEHGFLKSVSLAANGAAFDEAVDSVLQKCPNLGVGVHLNITNGNSLCSDVELLTDSKMKFNNSYWQLFIKSYNPKEKEFLPQVEREFRRQIEKVLAKTKAFHIDSHSHIHSIPRIFDLVCRLAKEYKIPEVRTHFEKFYFVPDHVRHLHRAYLINTFKKFGLNFITVFNENTVIKYGLKTNDYIMGIGYAHAMDALTIAYGLNVLKYNNITVEAIIHPCRYDEGIIDNHFDEFMVTRNDKLKDKILTSGYDITNYVVEAEETEKADDAEEVKTIEVLEKTPEN